MGHVDEEEMESDPIKYAKRRISQELGYATDEESLRIKHENEELKRKLEEMSSLLSQQQQQQQQEEEEEEEASVEQQQQGEREQGLQEPPQSSFSGLII